MGLPRSGKVIMEHADVGQHEIDKLVTTANDPFDRQVRYPAVDVRDEVQPGIPFPGAMPKLNSASRTCGERQALSS